MEALDGPLMINECLVEPSFCGQTPGCRIHTLFGKVNDKMKEILDSTTIADIANGGNSLNSTDERKGPSDSTDTGRIELSTPLSQMGSEQSLISGDDE
jgi:DNA-binding IscR family transcriptional regulator